MNKNILKRNNRLKTNITFNLFRIFILQLLISANIFAQSNCPPDNGNPWQSGSVSYSFPEPYGGNGSVNYGFRENNSQSFDLKFDWSTLQNTTDFVSDQIMKKILEREALALIPFDGISSINVYYTKPCYVKLSVHIKVEQENELECCEDGVNPDEIYIAPDGTKYYNVSLSKLCGYKCCSRVYTVERYWDDLYHKVLVDVKSISDVSVSNCSCENTYYDCVTGNSIPVVEPSCGW